MKKGFCILMLILLPFFKGFATADNIPIEKNDLLVQGFAKKISGTDIRFHSHLPYANEAMIVRTLDGSQTMEWESDIIPADIKNKNISLVWISGISGLMHGKVVAPITLYANDKKIATFNTAGPKAWDMEGTKNSKLSYRECTRDGSEDRFGYMFLRLPKNAITPGQPVRLKFVASNSGTDSWTMVFKSKLKQSSVSALCVPAQLRKNGKQLIKVSYEHFGVPGNATIKIGNITEKKAVVFGMNNLEISIDPVTTPSNTTLTLIVDDNKLNCDVNLAPIRKWEANFMQITHTDIGYTRPQTDILAEHVRFIDYVLDYCDATDNYPDESKFRWTCEGTWAVQEFLKSRPQSQIDRLISRIKEGRIELTAMYFNFDEMPDEQTLAASLAPLKQFKKLGLNQIQVATQNDVNGIGWCFNEFFPEIGVKYLTMGVNLHKALPPFDMPTYFWWTSPSGKKILAYYGEHYMHGNSLGINVNNFDNFESRLLNYLSSLDERDFKYNIIGIEFLGIGGDNSAPSPECCKVVKQWNEKYEWPKVRLSLFKDYLGDIENEYGNDIPSIRGAWPDWWTDGFASGAREAAATRTTHSELIASQNGLSIAKLLGSEFPASTYHQIENVNQALLFYDEHTFGADASIWSPFGKETMEQRSLKASYAWEGFRRGRLLKETALGFLKDYIYKAEYPSVLVFNPLSWERTGLAKTYIDFSILPLDKKFKIVDEEGNRINAQMLYRKHDGAYWELWVENVPSLGYKQYFIQVDNAPSDPLITASKLEDRIISNPWYEITINPEKGTLERIYDKELATELLENNATWQFGEFIHEKLGSRFLDEKKMKDYTRKAPENMNFTGYRKGTIWDTYSFSGHTEAGIGEDKNIFVEIRLFNNTKRIDLNYRLVKKQETNPEAVYISFPFQLPDAKLFFDVPGGTIEAGIEQIRGTSNDWNTVQTFAAVRNANAQIVMGTPEVPMMQFGDINTGRFQKMAVPASNKIYSYVMNNYWTTNFNADQHGEFEWNYFITSMPDNSLEKTTKFAWENRVPYITRTLPSGTKNKKAVYSSSFLTIQPDNVLLVNMTPLQGENSLLLHLREVNGKASKLNIYSDKIKNIKVTPSNVLGEIIDNEDLSIDPWETKFIKVSW